MPRAAVAAAAPPIMSPLGAAIAHLEAAEKELTLQIDAARVALSSLRLVHQAAVVVEPAGDIGLARALHKAPVAEPRGKAKPGPLRQIAAPPPIVSGGPAERILAAIAKRGGEVKFADIVADTNLAEIHARYHVKRLVNDGRLRGKGVTGSRRYLLPGRPPAGERTPAAPAAKEEP